MDFIFMLTRDDRTVEDCLEVLDAIAPVGLRHIGFKDLGAPVPVLKRLNARIKALGATSYLEVVSTSAAAALASARAAAEIGVDCLLGGTQVDAILPVARGARIAYFPFPGTPRDHPTKLYGGPEQVAGQCRDFVALGCAGADLLAYRAMEADPLALVRAARKGLGAARLIVAGSVNSAARVKALEEAGADAFTVGSAVFDGSYSPTKGGLAARLRDVLDACAGPLRA